MSWKPTDKKFLRIDEKIVVKVDWDASGIHNKLNLLLNLGVKSALPPDGGAAQAMSVVPLTDFQFHSPLWYIPCLSTKSLRSSIGG